MDRGFPHGWQPESRSLTLFFFPFDLWIISRILAAGAQNPGLYAALMATIHLMLFAIIVRLYSGSTTRDCLFLALMAFTSMLAAAILTVDTAFLVFFFVFMVLAVSTFVSLEMWRSAQAALTQPISNGTRTANRLHNALGGASTIIAIGSIAIGAVIFLLLPRFASGYMSGFNLPAHLDFGFLATTWNSAKLAKSRRAAWLSCVFASTAAWMPREEFIGEAWFSPCSTESAGSTNRMDLRLWHRGRKDGFMPTQAKFARATIDGLAHPLHGVARTDRDQCSVFRQRRGKCAPGRFNDEMGSAPQGAYSAEPIC